MSDKWSILFFCLLCCPTFLFSQQTQDYAAAVASRDYKIEKKSAIYTELLGNSLTGISINFDRIVKQFDESFLNITAGFGFNSGHGSYNANFPLSINYTMSAGRVNHHIEVGIGTGLNFFEDYGKIKNARLLLTSRIGYKYQRPNGGFYLRAAVTPSGALFYFKDDEYHNKIFRPKTQHREWDMLNDMEFVIHLVGLSVGYSF